MTQLTDHQHKAAAWFRDLRTQICTAFEQLEDDYTGPMHAGLPAGRFTYTDWKREDAAVADAGGGTMGVMKGRVFEKVGVNISTVHGKLSEEFRKNIPDSGDGSFFAAGISLVAHMHSPLVPAVHMNTRFLVTEKSWFGGGADLNPTTTPDPAEVALFHEAFKEACDRHDPAYYPKFKEWADDYFWIKHRNEARGVGGIFYDYVNTGSWEADFAFTQDVGRAFLDIYPQIVRRHMNESWTLEQRDAQLLKRGRYAEFNLVYDRGTTFGLKTGGNVEAILMSLPPEAKWA